MQFNIDISHALFIVYGVILGVMGNVTYRAEKRLPIKPVWLRLLWGFFALAVYSTVQDRYFKVQELNLINAFPIFILGFLSEYISKALPKIVERYEKKFGGGSDEKK